MPDGEPAVLGAATAATAATEITIQKSETGKKASSPGASARPPSTRSREARPSANAGPTHHVVGFWRRTGAGLVDLAILLPIIAALTWIAGALAGISLPASRHRGPDIWLDLLLGFEPALWGTIGLSLAIAAMYAFVFQATWGRTPGMRLLRSRIIDLYGQSPSVSRAGARTAGYLAGVATVGLGFAWIAFDSERRGLHDWLSGTYVVKE